MLFHKPFYSLHVKAVVHVGVPLQSWCKQVLVAETDFGGVLLILHVAVRKSRQFASLPAKMAYIETVVERPEKYESVHNHGPLVGVPPHRWVLGLNHL